MKGSTRIVTSNEDVACHISLGHVARQINEVLVADKDYAVKDRLVVKEGLDSKN